MALPHYLNAVAALEEITDRIVDGGCRGIAGHDARLEVRPRLHPETIIELYLIDFAADTVPGDRCKI